MGRVRTVYIKDIPRHIMYEATWVAGTGIPRLRFLQEIMMLTLLYTGYKMLGFTRGGHYGPPLETRKNEATEACEGSNEGFLGMPSSSRLFPDG